MSVLVDTSVLIDHLRGDERAVHLMASLFQGDERVWAATPTRTEILAGIRAHERAAMDRLFELLSWVDIDSHVADDAGDLARQFRRSHSGFDTVDYLIAAAARSVDADLLTVNVRHYPMFPNLARAYR